MRRAILFLLLAGAIVAGAWFLSRLEGNVSIAAGPWQAEIPLAIAGLGLLVGFLALHLIVRLIGWLFGIPERWRAWRARRDRAAGDVAVTRALVALAANDVSAARREQVRARRYLGDTPQTLLLTAEAARLANDPKGEAAAFEALTQRQDAAFLGWRGLLRAAAARQDWNEAARLARAADAAHPGAAWLKAERAALAVRLGYWREALTLSGPDAPKAAFALAAAQAEEDRDTQLKLLKQATELDPALSAAAVAYAARLRADHRDGRAIEVIERAWRVAPHPDLAEQWLLRSPDRLGRVRDAERLVRGNPAHPESRLLMAQVSLDAGLTGEARRHLELARADGHNTRRLWMLLADIEEIERGETEEGRAAQRDALRAAAAAEPDPAWRCGACGTVHEGWMPVCPACGTAGRIAWSAPARAIAAPAPAEPAVT
jgi:HemY protein